MSPHSHLALARIADALAAAAPEGWTKVLAEAEAYDDALLVSAYFFDARLGVPTRQPLPFDGEAAFDALRATMPGSDGWRTATFVLLPNGLFDCAFAYPTRAQATPSTPKTLVAA
ncbi:MAG: hypothetical protein ABIU95_10740 [Burkholderiales bacterium]